MAAFYGWFKWRNNKQKKWVWHISRIFFFAALCVFGLRIYATNIEPHRLVLRNVTIENPKVSHTLRILHISDIQSDAVGRYEEKVFERIRALQPDLLLFTGDLLQPLRPATIQSELPKIAALLETIHPPLGKFGVYGNIDGGIRNLPAAEFGGLKMLESQETVIKSGNMRIDIMGLSNLDSMGGPDTRLLVLTWFQAASHGDIMIVLGHRAEYVPSVSDLPIDLCLAGHTHGGQVRLPFYGPVLSLRPLPKSWAGGNIKVGNSHMNISAGIGAEHAYGMPALRFNCPPEITLIELRPFK